MSSPSTPTPAVPPTPEPGANYFRALESINTIEWKKERMNHPPTPEPPKKPVTGPHIRRCRDCGNVALHQDCITPWVLCFKCGSQDTRVVNDRHCTPPTPEPAPSPGLPELKRKAWLEVMARKLVCHNVPEPVIAYIEALEKALHSPPPPSPVATAPVPDARREAAAMALVRKMAARKMAYVGEVPTHNETKDDYAAARQIHNGHPEEFSLNGDDNEWQDAAISVPNDDACVLVVEEATEENKTFPGRRVVYPAYFENLWRTWEGHRAIENKSWRVTHWMPLPEPPPTLSGGPDATTTAAAERKGNS